MPVKWQLWNPRLASTQEFGTQRWQAPGRLICGHLTTVICFGPLVTVTGCCNARQMRTLKPVKRNSWWKHNRTNAIVTLWCLMFDVLNMCDIWWSDWNCSAHYWYNRIWVEWSAETLLPMGAERRKKWYGTSVCLNTNDFSCIICIIADPGWSEGCYCRDKPEWCIELRSYRMKPKPHFIGIGMTTMPLENTRILHWLLHMKPSQMER